MALTLSPIPVRREKVSKLCIECFNPSPNETTKNALGGLGLRSKDTFIFIIFQSSTTSDSSIKRSSINNLIRFVFLVHCRFTKTLNRNFIR